MSKKSTKATKTSKKTAAGTTGKSTKKAKSANERILEKFQTTDLPGARPIVAEPAVEPVAEAATADEDAASTAAMVAPTGDAEPAAAKDTTAPAGGDTGEPGATGGKRMGLVAAAIRVLQDDGNEPMSCPDLVKQATERGYWQRLAGKTPASTLYAAILREIRDKGEASRFRKTDRGKFALNKTS
ncbi:MAG TPA: winged helix-turn-helix domain-containing protein [Phycisphaerae bacterium]|nr:winged helix-turn-helix domain-containing protein [Phycisphaerae bacterium]